MKNKKSGVSLFHLVLRFGYRALLASIPKNRTGDKMYSFIVFVLIHKRLPTKKMLFADVLYRIKVTDNIIDPLRVFTTDKEFVKLYVKSTVGDNFNVKTIKVLYNYDDVLKYDYPLDCCIKPTHSCGQVILRKDGDVIDFSEIEKWFSINHYLHGRERNYKDLKPKVIVEERLENVLGENFCDYKIFCHKGKVTLIHVTVDRYIDRSRIYFNRDWEPQDFTVSIQRYKGKVERPLNLEKMIEVAEKLSAPFDFIRVDLYSDGKVCLVGELTHCHGQAGEKIIPLELEQSASALFFG
jgi:hypothetical protein